MDGYGESRVPQHRSQEFLASTGDLTGLLSLEEGTNEALKRITDLAASLVGAADGVGITLVTWGPPRTTPSMRTAAHSNPWVERVDAGQYATGEGPCIDAIVRSSVVNMRRLDDPRYPQFCARAAHEELGSVLAIPLSVNDKAVGALNLYARTDDAFDDASQNLACNFAAQAAIALVNIELYEGATKLNDQLNAAMDSRAIIEQAKGILMGREHCNADQAFEQLKGMSQTQNIKVRDLATTMVGEGGTSKL